MKKKIGLFLALVMLLSTVLGCVTANAESVRITAMTIRNPIPVKTGVGVGAGELKKAGTVFLMANGARKAEIVSRVLSETPSDRLPASLLTDHPNLTVYLDGDAASALKR